MRTWEFASRIIKGLTEVSSEKLAILAGTVGEGVAREFIGFCKIFKELPTMAQIVANPENIEISTEPSIQFALAGSVANHASSHNIKPLMAFISRLPAEFQVITLKDMVKRSPQLVTDPAVSAWIQKSASELM